MSFVMGGAAAQRVLIGVVDFTASVVLLKYDVDDAGLRLAPETCAFLRK